MAPRTSWLHILVFTIFPIRAHMSPMPVSQQAPSPRKPRHAHMLSCPHQCRRADTPSWPFQCLTRLNLASVIRVAASSPSPMSARRHSFAAPLCSSLVPARRHCWSACRPLGAPTLTARAACACCRRRIGGRPVACATTPACALAMPSALSLRSQPRRANWTTRVETQILASKRRGATWRDAWA